MKFPIDLPKRKKINWGFGREIFIISSMMKFPIDAPKTRVLKALEILGFKLVREREHLALLRFNPDGSKTPLTMPNHPHIKASTLRTICTQAGISREEFLAAYHKS